VSCSCCCQTWLSTDKCSKFFILYFWRRDILSKGILYKFTLCTSLNLYVVLDYGYLGTLNDLLIDQLCVDKMLVDEMSCARTLERLWWTTRVQKTSLRLLWLCKCFIQSIHKFWLFPNMLLTLIGPCCW
jgi:hypothetical protein